MTPADFAQLDRLWRALAPTGRKARTGPLARARDGLCARIMGRSERIDFGPGGELPPECGVFDWIVVPHKLMFAADPARRLRAVLARTRWAVVIAPLQRRRAADGVLGADGDRFRFTAPGLPATEGPAFSLDHERLVAAYAYDAEGNEHGPAVHVAALFRGDLAQPLVRIDDYPTGVRPVPASMAPIHDVLAVFDGHRVPYVLGIAPALLTPDMFAALAAMTALVPAVHGYDHSNPRYAKKLIDAGDPFNERGTVGRFNEFDGCDKDDILHKLTWGRQVLETALGRPVRDYIPPCNVTDRLTGEALIAAGFERVLSEKPVPGCPLTRVGSDFYGRSPDWPAAARTNPRVVTLHATWEWDVRRAGDTGALERMARDLAARRDDALHEAERLGRLFVPA